LAEEPRFKLRIHAELYTQFQQMRPIAMLNSQVENPISCLESALSAKDRMQFLPHSIVGEEAQQNVRTISDSVADGTMSESGQAAGNV
jgi:hypothetical protein